MRNALYVMYKDKMEFLYVGISTNPLRRFSQHANEKDWISEVTTMDIDWYDTREQEEAAEAEAIKLLKPRYNRVAGIQQHDYGKEQYAKRQLRKPASALHWNLTVNKYETGLPFEAEIEFEMTVEEVAELFLHEYDGCIFAAGKAAWDAVNHQGSVSDGPYPYEVPEAAASPTLRAVA